MPKELKSSEMVMNPISLTSGEGEAGVHTLKVGVTDRPDTSPSHSPKPPLRITVSNASSSFQVPTNTNAIAKNAANKLASAASQDPRRRVTGRPFTERRRGSILVGQRSIDIFAEKGTGGSDQRFVKWIIKKYKTWGYYIAEHDWKAVVICILISLIGMIKIFMTKQQNDITGYSPYGARSRGEYTKYNEFFAEDGLSIATYIYLEAKDGGSLLRPELLKEVVDVLDIASDNITMYNSATNLTQTFNEFCVAFCSVNEPVRQSVKRKEPLNDRIKLVYPISTLFGRKVSLQPYFFGIDYDKNATFEDKVSGIVDDETEPIIDKDIKNVSTTMKPVITTNVNVVDNEKEESVVATTTTPKNIKKNKKRQVEDLAAFTNIKSLKIITLQLRVEHQAGWKDADVKAYEMAIVNHFRDNYKSEYLIIHPYSQTYVEEEMVRGGTSLLPYLTVGFIIMCLCSIISVMIRAYYMHQCSVMKILLAVCACITPFMACATALAVLFVFNVRFASILCVIPFLALSIGVDSSYLMIHEWQRVTKHCRESPNRRNSTVGFRIAEVLSEVGPAVMISALTNIFADLVGCFTGSPEITLLCVGNLTTMFMMFIYQNSFYAGLMSLVGRYEIGEERKERAQVAKENRTNGVNMRHSTLNRQNSKFYDTTKHVVSESMHSYVSFVTHRVVATITIIIYFIFLAVAILGITRIRINLSTQKLFALDSPLITLDKIRVEHVVPYYMQATVFINNPGNLSDPSRMTRVNKIVADFEALKGSWGEVGTKYFMRDFTIFEKAFDEEAEFEETPVDHTKQIGNTSITELANIYKEEDLSTFVEWPEYDFWAGFIKLTNTTDKKKRHLEKFFFTTSYYGEENSIWVVRGQKLKSWRKVVDSYDDLEASVFHEDGVFLDLIDNMPTDTWQSIVGTMVCMSFVCFVFLNSTFTVVIASSCVLSISVGILGILSWWNIDLDPITMAAMIISIGFSVDIPAHVSYHYYQECKSEGDGSNPEMRLANTLSSVAFPAIQAAVSTTCCVCSLLFPKLYMAEVFVKTMILTVALCNLHGLVFLPAFLTVFDRTLTWLGGSKKNNRIAGDNSEMKWNPKTVETGKSNVVRITK
uniref:SSD domain-containing protein n=1 Tax=Rhabditophanes sp. KR3021 TaxID=114890 RepID=A0AC35U2Z8_9BILA